MMAKPLTKPGRTRAASAQASTRPAHTLAMAGALLGLLLGLCWFAPARWLASALARSGMVQLEDPRGTLWSGSARLWLQGGSGSPDRAALPQRLHWQWQAGWGNLALELRADCCTPQAVRLSLGWSQGAPTLSVQDGHSRWPAQVLSGLGTPWNTLQAAGTMALHTRGLELRWSQRNWHLSGSALLELQDLSSALSTLQPMGSYRLQLTGGASPALDLSTLRGDLLLSGRGSWQPQGLQFRGEARAAPGREDALANFLNIVGKRDGARTLISLG